MTTKKDYASLSTVFFSFLSMKLFFLISVFHLLEHFAQMFQLYYLHFTRKQSLGILGLYYPWLIHSEWLHFIFSVFTLVGLVCLEPKITKRSAKRWWTLSIALSTYHCAEHTLLLGQALLKHNLLNNDAPVSFGQLFLPRIELHFFYNLIIFIPMVIALCLNRVSNSSRDYLR